VGQHIISGQGRAVQQRAEQILPFGLLIHISDVIAEYVGIRVANTIGV
jgi:hypothetical protein